MLMPINDKEWQALIKQLSFYEANNNKSFMKSKIEA